ERFAKRVVELRVVALFVGRSRYPPADVDVVAEELLGELGAPAQRIEVAAAEIRPVRVANDVREGFAFAELELVPDKVDVVVRLGDGSGRPAAATSSGDQVDAGVDAAYVVGQVRSRDRGGDDVVMDELRGWREPVREPELLGEVGVVHGFGGAGSAEDAVADMGGVGRVDHANDLQFEAPRQYL